MLITKKIVADKIAAYLHHEITLAQLMDWAVHPCANKRGVAVVFVLVSLHFVS
jgi:hypothetical protein